MNMLELGWRDGVLLMAAVAAVYLLLTTLRLVQLRKRRAPDPGLAVVPDLAPAAEIDPPPAQWPPRWAGQWGSAEADSAVAAPDPAPLAAELPTSFGEHLAGSRLELEVRQLREEVGSLRREIAELKAARRVAPQYADAMALARRGYDAQTIADECGIAVAEAELVLAMSRDETGFDQEVDHAEHARNSAAGN